MDYLNSALGGFHQQQDPFAAVKLAMNEILAAHRLDELRDLVTIGHKIGGVEGSPGWIVERRDRGEMHECYRAWPEWAQFRAHVDPAEYRLGFPECFMDRDTFLKYVSAGLNAYLTENPHAASSIDAVRAASRLTKY